MAKKIRFKVPHNATSVVISLDVETNKLKADWKVKKEDDISDDKSNDKKTEKNSKGSIGSDLSSFFLGTEGRFADGEEITDDEPDEE